MCGSGSGPGGAVPGPLGPIERSFEGRCFERGFRRPVAQLQADVPRRRVRRGRLRAPGERWRRRPLAGRARTGDRRAGLDSLWSPVRGRAFGRLGQRPRARRAGFPRAPGRRGRTRASPRPARRGDRRSHASRARHACSSSAGRGLCGRPVHGVLRGGTSVHHRAIPAVLSCVLLPHVALAALGGALALPPDLAPRAAHGALVEPARGRARRARRRGCLSRSAASPSRPGGRDGSADCLDRRPLPDSRAVAIGGLLPRGAPQRGGAPWRRSVGAAFAARSLRRAVRGARRSTCRLRGAFEAARVGAPVLRGFCNLHVARGPQLRLAHLSPRRPGRAGARAATPTIARDHTAGTGPV